MKKRKKLPKVGGRTIKTILAVSLVSVLYGFINRNAAFACIGAVFGMGSGMKAGLKNGGNRFIGTLIGGMLTIPVYWVYIHNPIFLPLGVYLAVGLLLLIYTCQLFELYGGVQPGAVVLFVVIYSVSKDNYINYVISRIIDTGVGILVSLAISRIWLSPEDKQWLLEKKQGAKKDKEEMEVDVLESFDIPDQ